MARKPRKPPPEKFKEAIAIATHVLIERWKPSYIELDKLIETEGPWLDEGPVELMRQDPGLVPPIVVYPSRSSGFFDIIDGHHRYRTAQEIGLPGLWAVVIQEGSYA